MKYKVNLILMKAGFVDKETIILSCIIMTAAANEYFKSRDGEFSKLIEFIRSMKHESHLKALESATFCST